MPESPPATSLAGRRVALLLVNALPFFHILATTVLVVMVTGLARKGLILLASIYLAPPFFVRIVLCFRRLRPGVHPLYSSQFFVWWITAQGQVIFCRFPFLEELLRLVPGFYSAWLRLWGARVGRLTYWAPGVQILDRSLIQIGNDVKFGAGVRLNSHVIAADEQGIERLYVGPIEIGEGCSIGGYSLLTAGTVVEPGQTLRAFALSPPFSRWQEGRRTKLARPN